MGESKLQYECTRHGRQNGGLLISLSMPDGQVHGLNHCLVCLVEFLAHNGVVAMRPVVQVGESQVETEVKWELGEQ